MCFPDLVSVSFLFLPWVIMMADMLIDFTARTGDAGMAWVREFQRHCHVLRRINAAFEFLKRGQLEQARGTLGEAGDILESSNMPGSVKSVLNQSYSKVCGLYFYRSEEYARASERMENAHQAIAESIAQEGFLAPFAVQCPDLCLNQARVARNQRDWPRMHLHLRRMRAMVNDEIPLCTPRTGGAIFFSTLRSLFYSIGPETLPDFEQLCTVMEKGRRLPFYDRMIRSFLRFANLAIDYDPGGCDR
jgi:hypothetical protein